MKRPVARIEVRVRFRRVGGECEEAEGVWQRQAEQDPAMIVPGVCKTSSLSGTCQNVGLFPIVRKVRRDKGQGTCVSRSSIPPLWLHCHLQAIWLASMSDPELRIR